ncbi:hypothetical protein BDQ94DRAFT_175996 [Aspergillus welwitschiae]|uniref:Uncharacterized protein n=1 Tax=Aspergillus welwitschiae TaxID=1341132 RepID=A0A3F3PJ94_9EURO|nr:hypothetical protein BDQ94DRAFT_175996 [Aspergillus welwitschiae]RDH27001.1 hypothetical protein BDQ94DRAFT_175996 [Aspergillus welwitschiae]
MEADSDRQPSNRFALSALLSPNDDVAAQIDCILIVTTSAIEQLDHPFLRKEPVDMEFDYGQAESDTFSCSSCNPPLGVSWVFWTQGTDAPTSLASLRGVDYRSRPSKGVEDALTLFGEPQPHFHFDMDFEQDLSSFHIRGSLDFLMFDG